jgi:hypothetical protein
VGRPRGHAPGFFTPGNRPLTARPAYHYSYERRTRELENLADRLATLTEDLIAGR